MSYSTHLQGLFKKGSLTEVVTNNNKRANSNTLFTKHDLKDAWVQRTLKLISAHEKRPLSEIENEVTENVQSLLGRANRSAAIHGINVEMAVEKTLFKYFTHDPSDAIQRALDDLAKKGKTPKDAEEITVDFKPLAAKGAPEFDPVIFYSLVRRSKIENPSMFPLRNPFKKKPITSPRIILVPTTAKEDEQWNQVTTAGATAKGEFIFSVPFMQQCMNYSHARGIKPKGSKFESNGGTVPDEYAMIEFLIMHEFYHYTHGDFYRQKTFVDADGEKSNHTVANYTEDFRSNWDLAKAGYEPIPMGLYSKHVNYDVHSTYKDMYMMVKREMERLAQLPKKGDVVEDSNGNFHVVTALTHNGEKVETRPATPEEVAYAKANPPAARKKP